MAMPPPLFPPKSVSVDDDEATERGVDNGAKLRFVEQENVIVVA